MSTGDEPMPDAESNPPGDAAQAIAADIAKVLTPNEDILYIAMQNQMALSIKKDCAVATTNRLILYRTHLLGRLSFEDFQWQDVENTEIRQGILSSELSVTTTDGRQASLGDLNKDQAKRLYGICQQMEQEWREKRRVREMEQDRARSGGVYVSPPETDRARPGDDSVERLARAKAMLDQGLITETEYDTLKAKILSSM